MDAPLYRSFVRKGLGVVALVAAFMSCNGEDNWEGDVAPSFNIGQEEFSEEGLDPSASPIDYSNAKLNSQMSIDVDPTDLAFEYKVYKEIELELSGYQTGKIEWDVYEGTLPPGIYLDATGDQYATVFGTPEFSGQWCFTVSALNQMTSDLVVQEVCLVGLENSSEEYPKFKTTRFLKYAEKGKSYSESVKFTVPLGTVIQDGALYDGDYPQNLDVQFNPNGNAFQLSGRFSNVGVYRFSLMIEDRNGAKNYRQFQLTVVEKVSNTRTCPAGYYYDPVLGYCVQNSLNVCPRGSYYDPVSNACVAHPGPPPGIRCPRGTYYDAFLAQCVPVAYPRCPLNYRWSPYYNQCVRQPYTCRIGYRYDWTTRSCRYVWVRRCEIGFHWNSYHRRCVRSHRGCGYGYFYSWRTGRCERNGRSCGPRSHWNPRSGRCEFNPGRRCGPGTHWHYGRQQCVRNGFASRPRCGRGTHWSRRRNQCVANRRPAPRPRPTAMPRPRPMPMGMSRPMPRPTGMGMSRPRPRPTGMSMSRPRPRPTGMSMSRPRPRPTGMSMSRPRPRPTGMSMSRPRPRPMSMSRPMPSPMRGGMRRGPNE